MTGGGFGGSVVAVVGAEQAASFAEAVVAACVGRTGSTGRGFVCSAVDGASLTRR
jgi:galactokinase